MLPEKPTELRETNPDALLVVLAREVACDLRDLDDILDSLKISTDDWERIKQSPRFSSLLASAVAEWQAAGNTYERTRLKAAIMMEDWLVEAHARLHDGTENLTAKTEVAKLIARLAGMGNERQDSGPAEKVQITINLGGNEKLSFEHEVVRDTPKVIDADARPTT